MLQTLQAKDGDDGGFWMFLDVFECVWMYNDVE
jgi:hypothetical protein